MTTRMLVEDFNVDQLTIIRRLKKLGKVWKLAGWVPHELSDNNKANCVRTFTELLQQNEQTPFLQNLVTEDQSWLLFKNVKKKKVCVSPDETPKRIPKDVHCKKAVLIAH